MERSTVFWHPSLSILSKRCCDFPLNFERYIEAVQAVHLNDHVYVGGASSSNRNDCRLFVYSPSTDNWNVLDVGVSRFALTSYTEGKLALIGGKQDIPKGGGHSIVIETSQVLVLDTISLELQDQIIPSMQSERASACAMSSGDHLIVAGGDRDSANTVEVYNSNSNEWSYVSPLPQVLAHDQCTVKSGTLHSDGNLYVHLQAGSDKHYVFYAPAAALIANGVENGVNKWNNLNPLDDASQFLPRYVCSNLTSHLGHLILIGADSYAYSCFVYSPDDKRWVSVADLPLEERLVKPFVPPQDKHKNHIVSISSNELVLLGELVNSYTPNINVRLSFQGKCH